MKWRVRGQKMCWVTKWVSGETRIWNWLYQLSSSGPTARSMVGELLELALWIPPGQGRASSRPWALGTRSWGRAAPVIFPLTIFLAQNHNCLVETNQSCVISQIRMMAASGSGQPRGCLCVIWASLLEGLEANAELLDAFLNWKGLGAYRLKSWNPEARRTEEEGCQVCHRVSNRRGRQEWPGVHRDWKPWNTEAFTLGLSLHNHWVGCKSLALPSPRAALTVAVMITRESHVEALCSLCSSDFHTL